MIFVFSSRRRHTRYWRDWSSDVCSSDLEGGRSITKCTECRRRSNHCSESCWGRIRREVGLKKIYEMTAKELHQSFLKGEYSAVEIVEAFFQRIEAVEVRSEERRVGKECRSR